MMVKAGHAGGVPALTVMQSNRRRQAALGCLGVVVLLGAAIWAMFAAGSIRVLPGTASRDSEARLPGRRHRRGGPARRASSRCRSPASRARRSPTAGATRATTASARITAPTSWRRPARRSSPPRRVRSRSCSRATRAGSRSTSARPSGGWIYYYAHLAGYAPGVHEGQVVKAGDPLGYVGDTGNAGAGNYHLHFGLSRTAPGKRWYQGQDVDPYPLLAGKPAPR